MWDGDQMVQEAPLRLDGTIDETSAIRWHYEEGDHTPLAKQLPDGTLHFIVTDHLGTPKEMFDETGDLVWSATHYVWGAVRAVKMYGGGAGAATAWSDGGSINGGGTNGAAPAWQGKQGASLVPARERAQAEGAARELICPFRFADQHEDKETGLNYNRHRYYDALNGQYCSPNPIGLAGGDRPQGYVDNPLDWIDPLGLKANPSKSPQKPHFWTKDPIVVNGNKVYQRNDLINPNKIDPKSGKTNKELMQAGRAPLGPDGKPANLHLLTQSQKGPIAEVTQRFHKMHHKTLHMPNSVPSGINRSQFNSWRRNYWINRAKDF